MGFKIRYDLAADRSWSLARVQESLESLRTLAVDLGFKHVGTDLSRRCTHLGWASFRVGTRGAVIPSNLRDQEAWHIHLKPLRQRSFDCQPGLFSESLVVGLAHLPSSIAVSAGDVVPASRLRVQGGERYWTGGDSCKISGRNADDFLETHLRTIALLDAAIKLGLRVYVCDEGGYWTHRHIDSLLWSRGSYAVVVPPEMASDNGELIPPPYDRPDRFSKAVLRLLELTGGSAEGSCMKVDSLAGVKLTDRSCGCHRKAVLEGPRPVPCVVGGDAIL
ncbi:MAG: hypothetical protein ACYCOU_17255 [Sulfobacillus sp.]